MFITSFDLVFVRKKTLSFFLFPTRPTAIESDSLITIIKAVFVFRLFACILLALGRKKIKMLATDYSHPFDK